MAKKEIIVPIIHVGYMIQEILMQKPDYQNLWWVVWYNHKTMASAGMEGFKTFEEANNYNEANPPCKIADGDFDRSTIIYSGN